MAIRYRTIIGQSGADGAATGYGVFFASKKSAEAFRKQHGGKLSEVDGGWFIKKEIVAGENDPIIRAIRQAIARLGSS